MNLRVREFSSRVLGSIKERYGLRNKSEALDKLADMYGEKFAEREVRDDVVLEVIKSCEEHVKKHDLKGMSLKEFEDFCESL